MTATRESVLVGLTRGSGMAVGVAVAAWTTHLGSFGVGVMLAPALFGLSVLVATALGETVVRPRRPTGVRSASLRERRVRDYLPVGLSAAVAIAGGVGLSVLALTTATASVDETLGGARELACEAAGSGSSHGPYPGSYYSVPLVLTLAIVFTVALIAARQVVRRPRGLVPDDGHDDTLRRRSLDVVVAATGVAVCAPMAGVVLTAGGAMRSLATVLNGCAAAWMGPLGLLLLAAALAYLVLALICVGRLVASPPTRLRAESVAG